MVLYYSLVDTLWLYFWLGTVSLIFDSHSRDSSGRKVVNGTAVLSKLLSRHHLDNCIERTYFQHNSNSLCFQVQFVQIKIYQSKQIIQMSQYHLNDEEWICKIVKTTHNQGGVQYGESRGMQCSCMALMSVGCTLLKPISRWQTSGFDNILLNGEQLFKIINKFRYLSIDSMPNILKSKNSFLTIEYLENKTAEFVVKEYLATISEIISGCQFKGDDAILFINGFT